MDFSSPDGPPLNEKEAAAALGISRPTLQQGVTDGVIPSPLRLGRLKLYPYRVIRALRNGEPLVKQAG